MTEFYANFGDGDLFLKPIKFDKETGLCIKVRVRGALLPAPVHSSNFHYLEKVNKRACKLGRHDMTRITLRKVGCKICGAIQQQ